MSWRSIYKEIRVENTSNTAVDLPYFSGDTITIKPGQVKTIKTEGLINPPNPFKLRYLSPEITNDVLDTLRFSDFILPPVVAPVDTNRYLFFSTRNRMPSGPLYTTIANNNYLATKIKVGCPEYRTREFRFHFSGFASTEGGNSPQETVVTGPAIDTPGNSVIIDEFFVRYKASFYRVTFNGGANGATVVDQTNGIWSDALVLPGGVQGEGDLELWTFYHVANAGEKVWPVYRVQHHRGERVWAAADLATLQAYRKTPDAASTSIAISSTGDAGYGGQSQYQHYGPDFMVAKGDWDGRPVALVPSDSIGEARQEYGPNADARGNLGWVRKWLDKKAGLGRIPHLMIGMPGAAAFRELTGSGTTIATRRWDILDQVKAFNSDKLPFTVILNQLGQNDTTSYTTWWSRMTGFTARLRARYPGVRLVQMVPIPRMANAQEYKDASLIAYATNNTWPVDATDASGKSRLRADILALKDAIADAFIDTYSAYQGVAATAKPPTYDELPWTTVTEPAGTDGVAPYQSIVVADGSKFQPEQQLRIYSADGTTLISGTAIIASIAGNIIYLAGTSNIAVIPAGARAYQIAVTYSDGLHPQPVMTKRLTDGVPASDKQKLAA